MTQQSLLSFRSQDWSLAFSQQYFTSGFRGNRPIPISPDLINIGLQGHSLAVFCASIDPRSQRWIRGCQISQVQRLGWNIQPSNALVTHSEVVKLRIPTLIQYPKFQIDYDLRIDFYPWFSDLFVEIWEYNGVESDTTTDSLSSIQASLDQIIQRLPQP